jgi:hypothetical protein
MIGSLVGKLEGSTVGLLGIIVGALDGLRVGIILGPLGIIVGALEGLELEAKSRTENKI